ncbi:hypothetical protein B0T22DRAFT_4909 [Podospora appendiculata]|uniref:RRM domain-containing protein n=1 Tax=Podospora appendiculata TaxID=314037 RepID=A0AAE0XFA3_9PEZI|nr:hypothetical protein B0T22DRAFT_4909 [Podospora appendiculata]
MVANGKQVASDFEKIINEGRDRKKNEALAARIFSRDRRSSTPSSKAIGGGPGSLASRAGVTKRSVSSAQRPSAGNINGEWTHDLHGSQQSSRGSTPTGPKSLSGSLAARISNPNAGPSSHPRQQRRAAQVAQALIRTELQPAKHHHHAAVPSPSPPTTQPSTSSFNKGLTIRGLAGPFVVMAQNFAPGTTAADIESAMTPVGGIISSCRVLKQHPIVIAEIVFESKEGAESVIDTFNNQTADGRVLSVYPKATPTISSQPRPTAQPPTAPRAHREISDDIIVDGSLGFDDPMDTDFAPATAPFSNGGNGRQPPRGPAAGGGGGGGGGGGLYSDNIVRGSRRGRGGGRGRGGR